MAKKNQFVGESLEEFDRRTLSDKPELAAAIQEEYGRLQIARRVRQIREGIKMTQLELALKVGTKQPSIARLESGKGHPSLELLQKIAAAFGKTLRVEFGDAPKAHVIHESRRAERRKHK